MKILFQGDSVTDAGRDRTNPHDMGNGYPKYAAEQIKKTYPDTEFEFLNFGISANRSSDLLGRIENDLIVHQPDVVSVLIGVNDVWHRHWRGVPTTDAEFEANLTAILTAVREKTNAKILLMTPFLLDSEDKESWREELNRLNVIVRRLAGKYADGLLALDTAFAEALPKQNKRFFYSEDGVHPNTEGASFIGAQYLSAVAPLIAQIANQTKTK